MRSARKLRPGSSGSATALESEWLRTAITNQYQKLQELRQQMFQARIDTQDRIEGVLTKEQKGQLRRFAPWWGQDLE